MGMTIDDTISELETLKKCTFSYMRDYHAFTTAIKTMRKYQKIEQIIKDWNSDIRFTPNYGGVNHLDGIDYDGHYAEDYLLKIEELIEDKSE